MDSSFYPTSRPGSCTLAERTRETGMLEKVGEVRYWQESAGQVFVNGELWRAVSEFPLSAGDSVVVQKVDRLTVTVIPLKRVT